ncbi:MAG: hypothetical protein QM753_17490 [Thermomicrobiales bacterium]
MSDTSGVHSLSAAIVDIATQLAGQLDSPNTERHIAAISLIVTLDRMTDRALHAIVHEARAAGFSWQQIGDITGTSRQGAAQRFGTTPPAVDDLTVEPLANATALAASTITAFFANDHAGFRASMSRSIAAAVTAKRHDVFRRQITESLGELEAVDSAAAEISLLGDVTMVSTPLRFPGGAATGVVSFTPDARVLGFQIYPALESLNGGPTDG